jgi:centromere/kinetochore protein ZW10
LTDPRRLTTQLVLPRSQYLAALGHLVDITLSHLITSVLALVDIPQIESDHLVEILTELKSIESMGIFDSQPTPAHAGESGESMPVSSIATHVPHWLKFVYLIEMLGASLVDIGQLLDHGALIDFEKEELIRLIRALFAESEVREGVVSRIEAAS